MLYSRSLRMFRVRRKMTKPDLYYFTDSIFQLELNLHNIRRELIYMIEEFEKEDCFVCLQLKCRCLVKSPEKNTSLTSKTSLGSDNKNKVATPNKAPPADSLPKPEFEKKAVESLITTTEGNKDIEAWIENSRKHQAKTDLIVPTDVWLTSLRSWGESSNDVKKEKILGDCEKERIIPDTRFTAANAVEMFFKCFKVQPVVTTANTAYITKVAAMYGNQKSSSSEYTYF